MKAMGKLLYSRLDKNCLISTRRGCGKTLTVQAMVRGYEVQNDIFPDRIMCTHSTKVEENVIKTVAYAKFTNSRFIFNSMAHVLRAENMCTVNGDCTWESMFRYILSHEDHPEDKRQEYLALIDAGCDILVYKRIEMILVIDDVSRKVKSLTFDMMTTDMLEIENSTCVHDL